MNVIDLKNIRYAYPGGIMVFESLRFSLRQGERIGIVGANGSGKTTLFSLIMGLTYPQQGEVILWGKPCREEKDFHAPRTKIGYLFQDPDDQVFCPTVEEDIAFGPLNLGKSRTQTMEIVRQTARELNITHLLTRITTRLSWGQKRLVSLAGVLAMEPEVLILDEPTSSIDADVVQHLTDHLQRSHCSMVIASHDKAFLRDLKADIWLLKDGQLFPGNTHHNPKENI